MTSHKQPARRQLAPTEAILDKRQDCLGPTTPKPLGAAIARELIFASTQDRIEPRGYFSDASVDHTDARKYVRTPDRPEVRPWDWIT
jgi:hypothetical protein